MTARPITATYRLQFNRDFTFAAAEAIVPYLARLGISHVYASPITTAQPGSTHGYDVIDPTRVNPELGGEEGLRSLVDALKRAGMGLIIDIVPNHMGVAGDTNAWWQDVLARGPDSPFHHYFDIDPGSPILLPFLGAPVDEAIAAGHIELVERDGVPWLRTYGATHYPLWSDTHAKIMAQGIASYTGDRLRNLLEWQHYRLAWWRAGNDSLNWRRFFSISELAGLSVERDDVFDATHRLYFRLHAEGLIQGVRVDHVDGLTDPAGYCLKLRERLGSDAWILVEKILGPGEKLAGGWGIDGTTGYDFMEEVAALLHAPDGEKGLTDLWTGISGRSGDFHVEELAARRDMLAWEFEGQLAACVRAFDTLAASAPETSGLTAGMLRRAISALIHVFPVYRTYGAGSDAPDSDAMVRAEARRRAAPLIAPGEAAVVDAILAWLAGTGTGDPRLAAEAVRRFQQLSAPIAAKAVEDTAFYRSARLLSRNDVGFDAARLSMPIAEFHACMDERAKQWPGAMLATATHDHKRGEDTRARLAVLSALSDGWAIFARAWLADAAPEIDPADAYQLLQTLVGAWPDEGGPDEGGPDEGGPEAERILRWQEKALREAKLRSSWTAPDAAYEARARAFTERVLATPVLGDQIAALVHRITPAAQSNGLVQAFLRCTMPGVPDLYQGCEFADLSLVDPDNRRPVDYPARAATLDGESATYDGLKQQLIATLLKLRADHPALFAKGDYRPLAVTGERAGHVIAFSRSFEGVTLIGIAALRTGGALVGSNLLVPPRDWWGDTAVDGIAPEPDLLGAVGNSLFDTLPIRLYLRINALP